MENITQWHLTFAGLENAGLRIFVIILAVAALYFSWIGIKTVLPLTKRWLLITLRIVAAMLIVMLLLQPLIEQKEAL